VLLRHVSAIDAATEDREVTHVCLERRGGPQLFRKLRCHGVRNLSDPPALPADDVEVIGGSAEMVGRRPMAEVGVAHQSELFEQVESAVHRRRVDSGGGLLDVVEDLVGSGVAQCANRVQHQLALRCQPKTALPKRGSPVRVAAMGSRHGPSLGARACSAATLRYRRLAGREPWMPLAHLMGQCAVSLMPWCGIVLAATRLM
jgi:hypothetical protein